jgi:hypothetical protein
LVIESMKQMVEEVGPVLQRRDQDRDAEQALDRRAQHISGMRRSLAQQAEQNVRHQRGGEHRRGDLHAEPEDLAAGLASAMVNRPLRCVVPGGR